MSGYLRILAGAFLLCTCGLAWAAGDAADHVLESDSLFGLNDTFVEGDQTRYVPDIGTQNNVVIEEVFLRIRFNFGESVSADRFVSMICDGETFTPESHPITVVREGSDLLVAYGFVDRLQPGLGSTDCWQFVVTGDDPVAEVEVIVTFHEPVGMVELYTGGQLNTYPGEPKLLVDGTEVPDEERLIVFVHGWNPKGNIPHYDTSWASMYNGLVANPIIHQDGWDVARYQWHLDADTGPNDGPAAARNANYARDAAHSHGQSLGMELRLLDGRLGLQGRKLRKVHFVAHSAGNWVARRAADFLRHHLGGGIQIQLTSLDAFVNDEDSSSLGEDLNLQPNFELSRQWVDYLDNYYVVDFGTDSLGWTSGPFDRWDRNADVGEGAPVENNHGDPVNWYASTVDTPLEISLAVTSDPAHPGSALLQTVTVKNVGAEEIIGADLRVLIPEHSLTLYGSRNSTGGACATSTCSDLDFIRWVFGSLAPNEVQTVQVATKWTTNHVTKAPDGKVILLRAGIHSPGFGAFDSFDVVSRDERGLSLGLTADRSVVSPGEVVAFSLVYANGGDSMIEQPRLVVEIPEGTTVVDQAGGQVSGSLLIWDSNLDALGPKTSRAKRFSVRVNDGEQTLVRTNATFVDLAVAAGNRKPARAQLGVAVVDNPPLELMLSGAQDPAKPGSELVQSIILRNSSDSEVTNTTVRAWVPVHTATFYSISNTTGGACWTATCNDLVYVNWQVPSLQAGETRSFDVASTWTTNSSVRVPEGAVVPVSLVANSDQGGLSAIQYVVGDSTPTLNLGLESTANTVMVNDTVTFRATFGNQGEPITVDSVIEVHIPEGVDVVSAPGAVSLTTPLTWNVGPLDATSRGERTFVLRPTAVVGDLLRLHSQISSAASSGNSARAQIAIPVGSMPSNLALDLDVVPFDIEAGIDITQTLTVQNTGNQTIAGATARLLIPGRSTIFYSASNTNGGSCRFSTCDDLDHVWWALPDLQPGEIEELTMTSALTTNFASRVSSGAIVPYRATVNYEGGSASLDRNLVADADGMDDSDGDGWLDFVDHFPADPAEHLDTDGDGIGNNEDLDDDGDGLSDQEEEARGTNPLSGDTDGDGSSDGQEVELGSDPLNSDDCLGVCASGSNSLTNNGIDSGTISELGEIDEFTFTAEAGEALHIRVVDTSGTNFTPEVFLYNPDGTLLVSRADALALAFDCRPSSTDCQLSQTGIYRLTVGDDDDGYTGSYSIHFARVRQANENGELINDATVRGHLTVGDIDSFIFSANAGEAAHIRVVDTSGSNLAPQVYLYNPDGTLNRLREDSLAVAFDCYASSTDCQFNQTGTYRLIVTDNGDDYGGTFEIHFSRVNLSNENGSLVNDATVSGELTVGDIDSFIFDANAGEAAHIRVVDTSGSNLAPQVYLYNPDGTLNRLREDSLAVAFDCYASSTDCQFNQTGTYRLIVTDNGDDYGGTFEIHFSRVNLSNENGSLVNDATVSGELTVGDIDSFIFDANAGEAAHIRVVDTSGSNLAPQVYLYNPDGTLNRLREDSLAVAFDCYASSTDCQFNQTGTYRLIVTDNGDDYGGTFEIHFSRVNLSNENGSLVNDATVSGELTVGDIDSFIFDANAGEAAHIRVVDTSGSNLAPQVYLYNPDGTLNRLREDSLAVAFDCYASSTDCQFNQTGTYRLIVTDNGDDYGGTFEIHFSRVNLSNENGSLVNDATVSGELTVGDIDSFIFNANAGDSGQVLVTDTSDSNLTLQVYLYNPDGSLNRLREHSSVMVFDCSPGSIDCQFNQSGIYRLIVSDNGDDYGGTFEIHLTGLAQNTEDGDGDGIPHSVDNCPAIANPEQANFDGDSQGDDCDLDDDNDGLSDVQEQELGTNPLDTDSDNDGLSDGEEVSLGLNPLDGSDCPEELCPTGGNSVLRLIILISNSGS